MMRCVCLSRKMITSYLPELSAGGAKRDTHPFLVNNNVDDVGDDQDDDDDEVDEASTRSPSSSCSSAQAPPDGSRGHVSASTIHWFYSNTLSKY